MMIRVALAVLTVILMAACRGGGASEGEGRIAVDRLLLRLPSGWQQVPPSSQMRLAQFVIPGQAGAAEVAVFHFGTGQGGDVEANIARWIGQIDPRPGTSAQRDGFESGAVRVSLVDVEGTLRPGQMGMGPATAQPDSRLLGAVVEGEGGPWFFKATGPAATLGPQREAFVGMLRDVKLGDS